jgi:hypothetical protein
MKLRDLNENNLVEIKGTEKIVKIESFNRNVIFFEGRNNGKYLSEIKPVELDLIKLIIIGFKKNDPKKQEYQISIDNYIITLKVTDVSIYFMVNWAQSKEIEFVHQLQNLIYELTNKELEVSKL